MSYIPEFEIGIWNAWILMIWLIILPILTNKLAKDKKTSERLRTSVPIKFEKVLNIMSMTAVIFGFIYSIFLPIKYNTIWYYIGGSFFLFGIILYFFIIVSLRNASIDKPLSHGPYRFSRHPIYVSMLFIFISVIIMCLSWVFMILLLLLLVHLILSIPAEEKFCIELYGDTYREYMKKTSRWIGFPKK